MSDPRVHNASQPASANTTREQERQRALEDERRKQVLAHVEPARSSAQAHAVDGKGPSANAIDASHQEANRAQQAGRQFQSFTDQQAKAHFVPSLDANRRAAEDEVLKVADLQRKRDPTLKG